jgi:hypothetical protein
MKATFYRLGEYKIIEGDNGALWWEAHAGLGALIGGRCFTRGEILFIGPRESEESGFLANEFLNQLDRFPKWERTKFYCLNYEIRYCKSGRKLTEEEIAAWSRSQNQWTEETGLSRIPLGKGDQEQGSASTEDVSYRLGRYEIIKKPSGRVWWKLPSGPTCLKIGKSIIMGDILFIGAVEAEEPGHLRGQFTDRLDQLPAWRVTPYYSPSYSLYDCGTGNSLSEGAEAGWPNAESLSKGQELTKKKIDFSDLYDLLFSKFRKLLGAFRLRARRSRFSTKDNRQEEEETPETSVRNKRSQETDASKLGLSRWENTVQWLGRKKWAIYMTAFLMITGFLLMAILLGHWKEEEGHHKRDNHHSNHRNDH